MAVADVEDALVAAVDWLDTQRASIEDDVLGKVATFQGECVGDYLDPAGQNAAASARAAMSALLSPEVAATLLTPIMFQYGAEIGSPAASRGDLRGVLNDVWRSRSLAPRTIKSRNITRGSPSYGGSNAGTGLLSVLTTDRYGYPMESGIVETTSLRCVRDGNTGARRHGEVFRIEGADAAIDNIDAWQGGSGLQTEIISHHAGSGAGGSLVRNGAFSDYLSTGGVTTKFPGWTLDNAASFSQDSTAFRGFPGSSENTTGGPTAASMEFDASGVATQRLTAQGTRLDPDRPYFLRAMIQRKSSATGNFTLRFGAVTATQAVGSLTNDVWNEVAIALTANAWADTAYEGNLDIALEMATLTTGTVLVSDVLFAPYQYFNGRYFFLRGGATAWKRNDTISVADSGGAPADAKIQFWLQRAFPDYYWPATTGTPTVADPA